MAFQLERTKQYIKDTLTDYYAKNPVTFPTCIEQREFGFVPFGDTMRRHIGFGSYGQLNDYLRASPPYAAYYAVPYYKNPSALSMEQKGWQGADLFFDLDGDHMPQQPPTFSEMLELCKQETIRLYDDFLVGDLGFTDKDMRLMFSGGRGYHIHVFADVVQKMSSSTRREVIDYVTGVGLKAFEYERNPMQKHFNPHIIRQNGWGDRTIAAIDRWLDSIKAMGEKSARKMLKSLTPVPKPSQVTAILKLTALDNVREQMRRGEFRYPEAMEFFIDHMDIIMSAGSHIDAPVTGDVRRLARLPGSIHCKTGLRATILQRNQIDSFNPLVDAAVFGEEPVKILLPADQQVEVLGRIYKLGTGVGSVPKAVAMTLMLRGQAEVVL